MGDRDAISKMAQEIELLKTENIVLKGVDSRFRAIEAALNVYKQREKNIRAKEDSISEELIALKKSTVLLDKSRQSFFEEVSAFTTLKASFQDEYSTFEKERNIAFRTIEDFRERYSLSILGEDMYIRKNPFKWYLVSIMVATLSLCFLVTNLAYAILIPLLWHCIKIERRMKIPFSYRINNDGIWLSEGVHKEFFFWKEVSSMRMSMLYSNTVHFVIRRKHGFGGAISVMCLGRFPLVLNKTFSKDFCKHANELRFMQLSGSVPNPR